MVEMDYSVPFTKKSFEQFTNALNHKMTNVESSMAILTTDVAWTKNILWAILGILLVGLINIIMKGGY